MPEKSIFGPKKGNSDHPHQIQLIKIDVEILNFLDQIFPKKTNVAPEQEKVNTIIEFSIPKLMLCQLSSYINQIYPERVEKIWFNLNNPCF